MFELARFLPGLGTHSGPGQVKTSASREHPRIPDGAEPAAIITERGTADSAPRQRTEGPTFPRLHRDRVGAAGLLAGGGRVGALSASSERTTVASASG